MRYALFLPFFLSLIACTEQKMNLTTSADLRGQWIEVKTRTDTLTFDSWDNSEIMTLSRGKEMKDGHLLPKPGSGPYRYRLSPGSISLNWLLSSNSEFKDYSLQVRGNRLSIEDFYDSSSRPTLNFEKLD